MTARLWRVVAKIMGLFASQQGRRRPTARFFAASVGGVTTVERWVSAAAKL
jgi:hypothetical protein